MARQRCGARTSCARFNLDDRQIGLYQQFRAAVDRSLDELALSSFAFIPILVFNSFSKIE